MKDEGCWYKHLKRCPLRHPFTSTFVPVQDGILYLYLYFNKSFQQLCFYRLPPGVPLRLKFIRNDDNFVIIAASGEYRIKLLELKVEFRKINTETSIMKRELAAFERGEPYKMPFLASRFFVHTLPKGQQAYMLNDLVRGKFPQQLILGNQPNIENRLIKKF